MPDLLITKRGEGPNPIDVQVGRNLKVMRIIRGLSQDDLARKVGISFQQLQKYERGSNRISASRLYQLSVILDVSVQDFFGRSKKNSENINMELTPQEAFYISALRKMPENLQSNLLEIAEKFSDS